jgi:hypothetical protein
MRVRAVDANGDMVFGAGAATFLANTPQAVVQCVLTALKLFQGEWFLDTTAGMPWDAQVLGINPQSIYDSAIQTCIRGVTGVTQITAYSSSLNKPTRLLTVTVSILTAYGDATFSTVLPFAPPATSGFGIGGYGQTIIPES